MRIVVIQRHAEDLEGIRKCLGEISQVRAEEVIFTTDPGEVMRLVSNRERVFVVSSQYLEPGPQLPTINGTKLASLVKDVNRNAMFYIFSVLPQTNEFVDGVIPKEVGTKEYRLLAKILASDLKEATPQSLMAAFPEIWI